MTNLSQLRIHVAPVGFEIDRIVLPAIKHKADTVYLVTDSNPAKEQASEFIDKIQKELEGSQIQVKIQGCNRHDLFDNIRAIRSIFDSEKQNKLYVNVSSGSKIQAIACTMACMMFKEFKAVPYYIVPEKYPATKKMAQSSGMKEEIEIPDYEIQIPDDDLVKALRIIVENGGQIKKKRLAEIADERKVIRVGKPETQNYDKVRYGLLDKTIIRPLENKWKFVETSKVGRDHIIGITKKGEDAAKFLIANY